MDALKLSFSAAALVFLSAAARTGIVAPDFLLFLRTGSGRLDVYKLFQKVGAYCLIWHFHREDVPASFGGEIAVYAAGLFQKMNVRDDDVLLHGLAHVVDRERGGACCGERLHFHTGVTCAGDFGDDVNAAAGLVQCEPDVNAVDQDRMAHGDDIRCVLGGHDAGDLRRRQNIALFHASAFDQGKCAAVDGHASCGDRSANGYGFLTDIHHFCAPLTVEVYKLMLSFCYRC